jgi:flagellar biosynthesis protein FlhB
MRKRNVGILCTIWWLVWKEQNKHIFENSESSTQQAASSIEEKVKNNPFHLIAILTVTAVDLISK